MVFQNLEVDLGIVIIKLFFRTMFAIIAVPIALLIWCAAMIIICIFPYLFKSIGWLVHMFFEAIEWGFINTRAFWDWVWRDE